MARGPQTKHIGRQRTELSLTVLQSTEKRPSSSSSAEGAWNPEFPPSGRHRRGDSFRGEILTLSSQKGGLETALDLLPACPVERRTHSNPLSCESATGDIPHPENGASFSLHGVSGRTCPQGPIQATTGRLISLQKGFLWGFTCLLVMNDPAIDGVHLLFNLSSPPAPSLL